MKSVIAAFTESAAAHQAALELDSIGIENKNVRVLDNIEEGRISKALEGYDVPRERADLYKEVMRRGAALVTVETSDEDATRVASFLDDRGALDLDAAGERWRISGWQGYEEGAPLLDERERDLERAALRSDTSLDVIEEEVRVGKRDLDRGGVRVRAFVTERPIQEQVELREERIDVQREQVDEPLRAGDATFQEEEFVVTARGEEAVVQKEARVVERVHVDKDVEAHTETIEETERRRDVDVEPIEPGSPRR